MKNRLLKTTAVFVVLNLLFEIMFPTIAYALTGGPSQPEVQSFEPVGTTEMVDLSSGDFVYNIPLIDIEGYPINLSYHSGITMDQEASWVGLGWNINPGVINRNMRGIPDDFNGDQITKDMYTKPNSTYGMNFGGAFELFGFPKSNIKLHNKANIGLSASMGIFYNSYKGVGFEQTISPSLSAGGKLKLNSALAISGSTQSGLTVSPSTGISLSCRFDEMTGKYASNATASFSVGSSYNSRSGAKSLTFSKGLSFTRAQTISKFKDKENVEHEIRTDLEDHVGVDMNNGGSSLSYASQSYVPQISMPMQSLNMTFNFKLGLEAQGANPSLSLSGYYSSQYINDNATNVSKNSFGYLYEHNSLNVINSLHDLNREKDGTFSKNNPTLPVTNFTYDLYAVNGQGIGGMFRPHRSDIGHLHDDEMTSEGVGGSLGGELGAPLLLKWGANVNFNHSSSKSGQWSHYYGNGLASSLAFFQPAQLTDTPYKSLYEPAYFKNAGEKNEVDVSLLPFKELSEPLRPAFATISVDNQTSLTGDLKSNLLVKGDGNELEPAKTVSITSSDNLYRKKREPRNQNIQYLTVNDRFFCQTSNMRSYGYNDFSMTSYDTISRSDAGRKNHHITEITVLNSGGARYVYGIAAYNKTQEEITFTNKKRNGNECSTGLTEYDQLYYTKKKGELGSSANNTDAYDGFYNATTLPAYAHSYLLTSVLSSDYVDKTLDGISDDDLGTYTKINYTRTSSNYAWRTPFNEDKALYHEGLKTDDYDDKGTIVYGEKEVWYIHSIESKNFIARFTLSQRNDGMGVVDVHGGINTSNKSYKLESIKLYSKSDVALNGANAIPIKSVFFEYNETLCMGIANSSTSQGKLTLTKVYFTYGASDKGKLSSYQFTYASGALNPNYDVKGYDRWGNYKPNPACDATEEGSSRSIPTNAEFPYTTQNATQADNYAQAWSLNEIKLPSGGIIKVSYESDDYAYVQDKKAMQMFRVKGFSNDGGSSSNNKLYESEETPNNWVHITLDEACTSVTEFKKRYYPEQAVWWDQTRFLYFTFLTYIKGNTDPNKKEFVRGYAELGFNVNRINDYEYALDVRSVKTEDNADYLFYNTSPFAKAAWQYFRLSLPQVIYPGSDSKKNPANGAETAIRSLFQIFYELKDYIQGLNNKLLSDGFAQFVDEGSSWVRLNNPNGFKKGGGARVSKVELEDSWNSMRGFTSTEVSYGQEYDYTTTDVDGRTISSGVASYEPGIGNDENPFRQPILYKKENALIPNETFYAEEPMGESYFPSPGVTYAKVTVKNLQHTNVVKHATGKVIHEYYTTRDFPTFTKRTSIQSYSVKPDWIGGLFSFKTINQQSFVQGYQIELNDMNGKPKAEWVYAESTNSLTPNANLISGMKYIYQTDPSDPRKLSNYVRMINPDGEIIENVLAGVESDLVFDTRENESNTVSCGISLNNDFIIPFFVLSIPIPFPSYSGDLTRFRSAVLTRVVQRYGILQTTIAYQDKATIQTENYAYDSKTGEVLMTKTQNEYKDDIYNLTYPAHWAYGGMGLASENWGAEFDSKINADGNLMFDGLDGILRDGDELRITPTPSGRSNKSRWWVYYINSETQKFYHVEDEQGRTFTGNDASSTIFHIKVLRSGSKNMQNVPIAQITSKSLPIVTIGGKKYVRGVNQNQNILNASNSVYSESWKPYCKLAYYPEDFSVECEYNSTAINDVISSFNYLIDSSGLDFNNETTVNNYDDYLSNDFEENIINDITPVSNPYAETKVYDSRTSHTYLAYSSKNDTSYYGQVMVGVYFPRKVSDDTSCGYYSLTLVDHTFITTDSTSPSDFFDQYKITKVKLVRIYPHYWVDKVYASVEVFYKDRITNEVFSRTTFANIGLNTCYDVNSVYTLNGCLIYYDVKNQFITGERGNWRKLKDYLYLANRTPGNSTSTDIRKDGKYAQFDTFWGYSTLDSKFIPPSSEDRWTWTSQTTNYIPEGQESENVDKLGRYNAALFNTARQPVAVANNARYREIGSDGFEESSAAFDTTCSPFHWRFPSNVGGASLDNNISHTGKQSLKITGDNSVSNTYFTSNCGGIDQDPNDDCPCKDCIRGFAPYPDSSYVLSGWVRASNYAGNINDRNVEIVVSYNQVSGSTTQTIKPKGSIIEGWQRFDTVIHVPNNARSITVTLNAAYQCDYTWYDDLRIFPVHGNMKTFVYDPVSLRTMSELDENNYASFYEYDEQGALKRVKKETERGVMTLKESRNHTKAQ